MNIFYLYFIEMSSRRGRTPIDPNFDRRQAIVNIRATNSQNPPINNPGFTGITPAIVNKRSNFNKSLRKPNIGGKLRRKTKKYHKKSKKRVRKCKKCRGTQKRR